MKRTKAGKPAAQRLTDAMRELEQAMKGGKRPDELFTVHTVHIPTPREYDAKSVRQTRARLHLSQALFAQLLGVSVELVEHWEQSICAPRGPVRRLLDEINRDPKDFLDRNLRRGERLSKAG